MTLASTVLKINLFPTFPINGRTGLMLKDNQVLLLKDLP